MFALVVRVWRRLLSGVAALALRKWFLEVSVVVKSVSGVRCLVCPKLRCQLEIVCFVVDGVVPIVFAAKRRNPGV